MHSPQCESTHTCQGREEGEKEQAMAAVYRYQGSLIQSQTGYVTIRGRSLGIYGNVNQPCPRASPSDSVSLLP